MTWTSQAQGVKFGRRSPLNRGQLCTPFHRQAGILGTGPHAYRHAEALFLERDIETVLIWDTDAIAAQALAARIKEAHRATVEILDEAEAVVRRSDIVVTVTPSRSPIVQMNWLHPGLHITAVGAHTGDKNEFAPEVACVT